MTQVGEAVGIAKLDSPVRKCPFEEFEPGDEMNEENENVVNDDTLAMQAAQDNDGGVLGQNLITGSPGAAGTWNAIAAEPPDYSAERVDTARAGVLVRVPEDANDYPFTVAAHHLIPGNASLYDSSLFKSFMRKNGKLKVKEPKPMTFTLSHNIGYNVNGSHNGVWLPGSYAIRSGVHPSGATWSVLISKEAVWCYSYMGAAARKARGQFHDTHVGYSDAVSECLEKLSARLVKHQQICEECQSKDKIPPPYVIKSKLYRLSQYLRTKTLSAPRRWRKPWITSDQVRTDVFKNPAFKKAFFRAFGSSK